MVRTFRRECPQCSQQVMWPETPTYPFCSERCRLIDLGVWATEGYRIAGEPLEDAEDGLGASTRDEDRDEGWGDG